MIRCGEASATPSRAGRGGGEEGRACRPSTSTDTCAAWALGRLVHTVDTFKSGDPRREVKGIAVAWRASCRRWRTRTRPAAICSSPTSQPSTPTATTILGPSSTSTLEAKRDSWARAWSSTAATTSGTDAQNGASGTPGRVVWGWPGRPLAEDARRYDGLYPWCCIKDAAATLGRRPGRRACKTSGSCEVQFVGDGERMIRAPGDRHRRRLPRSGDGGARAPGRPVAPDALLVTDDGIRFWADGSWAIDRDLPLLVVNHATAEEWGMRSLAVYLREAVPRRPGAPSLTGLSVPRRLWPGGARAHAEGSARMRRASAPARCTSALRGGRVRLASPDCLPLPIE